MLKSLLERVKTEKAKSKRQEEPSREVEQVLPPESWDEATVSVPEPVAVGAVPLIRYCLVRGMPNLTRAIDSCPIQFHVLPFSKRRVKEVDLDQCWHLPPYLSYLLRVFAKYLYKPNHFLINDYPPGIGILPHLDGPAYHPQVLVYSIGTAIIEFSSCKDRSVQQQVLLEDGSLHLFSEEAYTAYLHGVHEYGIDCIYMQIEFDSDGRVARLLNCSVINLPETGVYLELTKQLRQNAQELVIGNYSVTRVYGNSSYNYKLESQRSRRISITIRHKYRQSPADSQP